MSFHKSLTGQDLHEPTNVLIENNTGNNKKDIIGIFEGLYRLPYWISIVKCCQTDEIMKNK